MGTWEVREPGGRTWVVTRRWVGRAGGESPWRRFRRRLGASTGRLGGIAEVGHGAELFGTLGEIPVVGVVFLVIGLVLLAVVLVLLVALVLVPLLFAVVELTVLALLAALAVGGRTLFRHPWVVEARSGDGAVHTWPVVGWRASRRRRAEIAELLAAGVVPPR